MFEKEDVEQKSFSTKVFEQKFINILEKNCKFANLVSISKYLLVFFASELSLGIGDVNIQSSSPLDDGRSFSGTDTRGDLASPLSVAHHQTVEFVNVMDEELFEAHVVSAGVSGIFVGSITDTWMASLTTKSSSEGTIDTFWSSPAAVSDSDESAIWFRANFLFRFFKSGCLQIA